MVTIAGVLGVKQVALGGGLAVEAGIFPFLILVALSSAVAELHGKEMANRLRALRLRAADRRDRCSSFIVVRLPTDPGMYQPAQAAFPIVLGQSWRLMAAGIVAYGISVTLNIWIFRAS